jgi:hypothetical protein
MYPPPQLFTSFYDYNYVFLCTPPCTVYDYYLGTNDTYFYAPPPTLITFFSSMIRNFTIILFCVPPPCTFDTIFVHDVFRTIIIKIRYNSFCVPPPPYSRRRFSCYLFYLYPCTPPCNYLCFSFIIIYFLLWNFLYPPLQSRTS